MEENRGHRFPKYHALVPVEDDDGEEEIRMVGRRFPKCAAVMRERVVCEREGTPSEVCDQLWGAKLAWCIVSSTCPTQATDLVQCQGFIPDTADKDYTPIHCQHRQWVLDRCLSDHSVLDVPRR